MKFDYRIKLLNDSCIDLLDVLIESYTKKIAGVKNVK